MNNERILSYATSRQLTLSEAEAISAGFMTSFVTANGSHTSAGWDSSIDCTLDL